MTVEEKALIWARKQKGNVLNNKNVDCFIAGYNMAAKEYREIIDKGYKEVLIGLPDKLEKQLEDNEAGIWYSGYIGSVNLDEYEVKLYARGEIKGKLYQKIVR